MSDHLIVIPVLQRGRHHRRRGAGRRAPRRRPRRGRRLDGRLGRGGGVRRGRRDPARAAGRQGGGAPPRADRGARARRPARRHDGRRWPARSRRSPAAPRGGRPGAGCARHRWASGRDRAARGGGAPSLRPGRGDTRGRILHQLAHRRCRVRHAIGVSRLPRRPDRRRAPAPRGLRPRVRDADRRGRPRVAPRRGAGGGHPLRRAAQPLPSRPRWHRRRHLPGGEDRAALVRGGVADRPGALPSLHRGAAAAAASRSGRVHRVPPPPSGGVGGGGGRVHGGPYARDLAGLAARSAGAAHARGGGGDGGHARAAGPGPRHAGAAAPRPRSHPRLRRPVLLPGAPGRRRARRHLA